MGDIYISDLLLILSIVIVLVSQLGIWISYAIYKKVDNSKGITGADVAREILDKNGLSNIYVTATKGNLTDHFDSKRKVIRLSTEIYEGESIASIAVAAHEVGHAIQDKEGYRYLKLRNLLIPLVNFSSYAGYFAIVIGFLFSLAQLVWVGIFLEVVILLFQLITLPVEFDASKRAKSELLLGNYLEEDELKGCSMVLYAAAFTYVASVLSAILQVLRLIIEIKSND